MVSELFKKLQPRSKVWLEHDGRVVLSEWRVALLCAVEETGSLVAAATKLDVPHRTAWEKIRQTEKELGIRLLDTRSGGSDGGRSMLTIEARDLVRRFQSIARDLTSLVDERFQNAAGTSD